MFEPIGYIQSPYDTNFGIPRQPGLVSSAEYRIRLPKNEDMSLAIRGIEDFSHIWVLFLFHKLKSKQWKPLINPPRFADGKKVGVFATRSPYRPNPIGQSAVKLEKIDLSQADTIDLIVSGGDFMQDTPVLDIKPYIPYADSISDANPGWASPVLPSLEVRFSEQALEQLRKLDRESLRELITETLSFDPRPGYERGNPKLDGQSYFIQISQLEIEWVVEDNICQIIHIKKS